MARGFRIGPSSDFDNTFAVTANPDHPLDYTHGARDGIDWLNVASDSVLGIGYAPGTTTQYEDALGTIQGRFDPVRHWSEITVYKPGGYTPPDTHEIECLVAYTISGHSTTGYEMDFGYGLNIQPVRLEGSPGVFSTNVFTLVSGNYFAAEHGDVIRTYFSIVSGNPRMSVYRGLTQMCVFEDATAGKITSGSPGLGFFGRPGCDMKKYAVSRHRCGSY